MNSVFLAGWVTDKPVYGQTNKGLSYANFSLGVMNNRKGDEVLYVDCISYDKVADRINTVVGKGDYLILYQARLQMNKYENKEGVKIKKIKIIVNNFIHEKIFTNKKDKEEQEKTLTEAYNDMPY